jgi:hypothetical protein
MGRPPSLTPAQQKEATRRRARVDMVRHGNRIGYVTLARRPTDLVGEFLRGAELGPH